MRSPPHELHPQDWILIAEALVHWAGNPNEVTSTRGERAYEIVEKIAHHQELSMSELIRQIDDEWGGP